MTADSSSVREPFMWLLVCSIATLILHVLGEEWEVANSPLVG